MKLLIPLLLLAAIAASAYQPKKNSESLRRARKLWNAIYWSTQPGHTETTESYFSDNFWYRDKCARRDRFVGDMVKRIKQMILKDTWVHYGAAIARNGNLVLKTQYTLDYIYYDEYFEAKENKALNGGYILYTGRTLNCSRWYPTPYPG